MKHKDFNKSKLYACSRIIVLVFVVTVLQYSLVACELRDIHNQTEDSNNTQEDFESTKDYGIAQETKEVILYLGDKYYYKVVLPLDLEINTDNSKYITSRDESVYISVISGIKSPELSKYAMIEDATAVTPKLIRTRDVTKKNLDAAKWVVGDKGIVVRTINNPVAFNTIVKGLSEIEYEVSKFDSFNIKKGYTKILKKFPKYSDYEPSITVGLDMDIFKVCRFDYGTLTIYKEYKKFEDSVYTLCNNLTIVTGSEVPDVVYETSGIFYAEKGEYAIAVVSLNFNTSITLYGYGSEAKCNLIAYINSL